MPGWLIIRLVFGAFFLWAGDRLRVRSDRGPSIRDGRDQSTRGGDATGGG